MTKDKTGKNKEYKDLTVEVTQDQVYKQEDGIKMVIGKVVVVVSTKGNEGVRLVVDIL